MLQPYTDLSDFLAEVVMTSYYLAEPPQAAADLLHDAEMKCLKVIAVLGPLQMQVLAAALHVSKPRVTRLVSTLVERRLVQFESGQDKRSKLVSVTPAGRKLVQEIQQKFHELAQRIERRLGPEKSEELRSLLAEITPLADLVAHNERSANHAVLNLNR